MHVYLLLESLSEERQDIDKLTIGLMKGSSATEQRPSVISLFPYLSSFQRILSIQIER